MSLFRQNEHPQVNGPQYPTVQDNLCPYPGLSRGTGSRRLTSRHHDTPALSQVIILLPQ